MSLQSLPEFYLINQQLRTFFLVGLLATFNVSAGCVEGDCVSGKGDYTFPNGDVYEGDFLKSFAEREIRIAKEEKARKKFDKIFAACVLDKSSNVDLQVRDTKEVEKKSCKSIAEDPSLFEIWKYD